MISIPHTMNGANMRDMIKSSVVLDLAIVPLSLQGYIFFYFGSEVNGADFVLLWSPWRSVSIITAITPTTNQRSVHAWICDRDPAPQTRWNSLYLNLNFFSPDSTDRITCHDYLLGSGRAQEVIPFLPLFPYILSPSFTLQPSYTLTQVQQGTITYSLFHLSSMCWAVLSNSWSRSQKPLDIQFSCHIVPMSQREDSTS